MIMQNDMPVPPKNDPFYKEKYLAKRAEQLNERKRKEKWQEVKNVIVCLILSIPVAIWIAIKVMFFMGVAFIIGMLLSKLMHKMFD